MVLSNQPKSMNLNIKGRVNVSVEPRCLGLKKYMKIVVRSYE